MNRVVFFFAVVSLLGYVTFAIAQPDNPAVTRIVRVPCLSDVSVNRGILLYASANTNLNFRIRNAGGITTSTATGVNWTGLAAHEVNIWWNPSRMHIRVTRADSTQSDDDANDYPAPAVQSGTVTVGTFGGFYVHAWMKDFYSCPGPVGCRDQVSKWGNP